MRERLIAQGATPAGGTPADFAALIAEGRTRYTRIIAEKHIIADP